MRHLVSGRKLNRTASHRKAMLANMAVSLLDTERVVTTLAKAKEARSVVERLITYAKKGTLHHRRLAARIVRNKTVLKKLFDIIGPSYKDREGGYTRVIRVGERRGDNALTAILELVDRSRPEVPARRPIKEAKKKASRDAATSATTANTGETPKSSVVSAHAAPENPAAAAEEEKK